MSQRWATFQEMSSVRLRSFLPGKLCSTPQPETVRRWCVSGWLDGGIPTKNSGISGMRRCEVCSGLQPNTFAYFYYFVIFCVYRLLLPTCIYYPRRHLRTSIIPVPDIDLEDFGSALTVHGLLRLVHTPFVSFEQEDCLRSLSPVPHVSIFSHPQKEPNKKLPVLGRSHHQHHQPSLAHPRHAVLCCDKQPEVRHRPRCLLALLPSVLDAGFGDLLGAGTAGDPGREWQVGDDGMVPIVLFVVG